MVDGHGRVAVALVGYGLGGSTFHAPFVDHDPRLELVAVVTSDPARQAAVAARHPAAVVTPSLEALLGGGPAVDLAVVTTPNATHVEVATACLDAGLHLVVDKPVAPSAAETRRLVERAAAAGLHLIPFHNRRWDGDFRTAAALVRDGGLGTVHRYESRYERWQPVVPGGPARSWKRQAGVGLATGILWDLGTHVVDQAVHLFGRPSTVYAEVAFRRPGADVDDDAFVALGYTSGLVAHLWASAVAADQGPRLRLLGSAGAYVKHGMDGQEAALGEGRGPGEPGWGEEPPSSWGALVTGDPATEQPVPTVPGAYQDLYAGVAACLLDGSPPPVEAADAVTAAEVVEAAHRSAIEGRVVRLS
jgi:scyllo-inositol 2-dehydrogenase (NADP+)